MDTAPEVDLDVVISRDLAPGCVRLGWDVSCVLEGDETNFKPVFFLSFSQNKQSQNGYNLKIG